MFYVGFDVLRDTIQKILSHEETVIDPLGATLGIISAAIMFLVYLYNTRLSKKSNSKALSCRQGQSLLMLLPHLVLLLPS